MVLCAAAAVRCASCCGWDAQKLVCRCSSALRSFLHIPLAAACRSATKHITLLACPAALKLVASLAAEASSGRLRGAALLDLLHTRCAGAMGDAAAHRLALRLLRAAAEPYFGMLERWL